MTTKPTFKKKLGRRLAKKTNYMKREAYIKSKTLRLVIRKTNMHITAQLVEFVQKGDQTIAGFTSKQLEKYGMKGKGLGVAYLSGYALGQMAKKKGHAKAILDLGLQTAHPQGQLFAALKGALDAGMSVAHSPEILPTMEIIAKKTPKEAIEKAKKEIENAYR